MRIVVLLSAGRHPGSGRPCPVPVEAQAIALGAPLGAVTGLHAGGAADAVADQLGQGLPEIGLIALPAGADPVPALAAALRRDPPDLVLAGRRGQGGADTGLVPYLLAARLGWPIAADAVALAPHADGLAVEQALPRGRRRGVVVALPAVVTVHPAAPPARPFAFAARRRGRIVPQAAEGVAADAPAPEERPYRRRPRLIRGAPAAGSAEERLRRATETAAGGRLMIDPPPDEAAAAILDFLRQVGVIEGA